jgi:uncharacterized membrane protein YfcA
VSLATIALVAAVGALIGAVGLGGFLMVPILILLEGASVRQGVVIAAVAFLASGVVSLALRRRQPGTARGRGGFLLAAAPGAVLGALAVQATVEGVLTVLIALGFTAAGIAEWLEWPRQGREREVASSAAAGGGLVTGFASALTGTSGPMVAMPMLAWAGLSLRDRVALAQVAQIPIALGATLAFASLGEVPWLLAAGSSAALCVGLLGGALLARRVQARGLRRLAAVLMWCAAIFMLLKASW